MDSRPTKAEKKLLEKMDLIMENIKNPRKRHRTFKAERRNILESSYNYVSSLKPSKWYNSTKYPLPVVSMRDISGDKEDVDLTEWLSSLIESFFKKDISGFNGEVKDFTAPLFEIVSDESGLYAPNMKYPEDVFKFAGSIVALAFNNGVGIRVEFIESIYRRLWDEEKPYDPSHLQSHDPVIYKQFQNLLLINDKDIILNTMNIDLEGMSVEEYVRAQTADIMYLRYKDAIDAFVEGFDMERNSSIRRSLTRYQFEIILTGVIRCSVDDLYDAIRFEPNDKWLKGQFRSAIKDFTKEQVMKFIKFVTNISTLSFEGIPDMVVSFNRLNQIRFPIVEACFQRICLPKFTKVSELRNKLIFSIEETDTFELD